MYTGDYHFFFAFFFVSPESLPRQRTVILVLVLVVIALFHRLIRRGHLEANQHPLCSRGR